MIRATTLRGRAVVDLDSATKLGQLDELILDPEDRRVAGLIVTQGQTLLGERHERILPAATVNAIGPDALTVRAGATELDDSHLSDLPRLSSMTGRKVVTHSGRMLGVISDVLISPEDGTIIGYALDAGRSAGRLEELFGGRSDDSGDYIRSDADLRVGEDLVVVPDDAVVSSRTTGQRLDGDDEPRQSSPVRWLKPRQRNEQSSAWLGGGKPVASAEEPVIDVPIRRVEAEPVQIHEAQTRAVPFEGDTHR